MARVVIARPASKYLSNLACQPLSYVIYQGNGLSGAGGSCVTLSAYLVILPIDRLVRVGHSCCGVGSGPRGVGSASIEAVMDQFTPPCGAKIKSSPTLTLGEPAVSM